MQSQSTKLYNQLQKRYSRRINLDLKRIRKVLFHLKNPHHDLVNPINIIGSDGKMSVLTSLKYFIEADKKKVTAFTSPHLYDVRTRIWLKNRFINIREIQKLVKKIEKTKLKLTLFELLTCVYILAARKQKNISYNLVESGLLFRKDSTNLWKHPKIQIITNINFQHQNWVNPPTIKQICKEKVGYLSKNSTIYIGQQEKNILKIIKKILKKNPSKKILPSSWKIINRNKNIFYRDKKNLIKIENNFIKSSGLIENLGLAIKIALDLKISKKIIIKTIPKIKFEGRVQYLKKGKLTKLIKKNEKLLVDGCHSQKSAENLYKYLRNLKEPIYGIWGMKKDKSANNFIKSFKNIFKRIITVNIPGEINSIRNNELKKISDNNGNTTFKAKNLKEAISKCSNREKKIIVIFGSLYLVGHALSKN